MVFLSQDSDTARTSGLAECAKAVNKTNLGRRLLMLICMKPRLLQLQKSTNESTWGVEVMLGTVGPGLTSTSPEEQRRSRIRVRLKAIRADRLLRTEQRVKGAGFCWNIKLGIIVQMLSLFLKWSCIHLILKIIEVLKSRTFNPPSFWMLHISAFLKYLSLFLHMKLNNLVSAILVQKSYGLWIEAVQVPFGSRLFAPVPLAVL